MIQAYLWDWAKQEFFVSVNGDGRLIYYICVNIIKIVNWVKIILDRRCFVRIFVITIALNVSFSMGQFLKQCNVFLRIYQLYIQFVWYIISDISNSVWWCICKSKLASFTTYLYGILELMDVFPHLFLTASNCAFNWNFNSVWWHRHT